MQLKTILKNGYCMAGEAGVPLPPHDPPHGEEGRLPPLCQALPAQG
jgi:hypothetical protein